MRVDAQREPEQHAARLGVVVTEPRAGVADAPPAPPASRGTGLDHPHDLGQL
ncbi:MAG: hypothetical protein LH603_01025 [Pseudonocardia sp.]|nr:hypothetical protein [Pseudonocardia sp.]